MSIESLQRRNSLACFIAKHPHPESFIQPDKFEHRFERAECLSQVFSTVELAENFMRFMWDRGFHYRVVPQCPTCKRVHCLRLA